MQPIIQGIKERINQRRIEKLNDEFLQRDLEEHVKFLEEEKKLKDELGRYLEELNQCEDEEDEKVIKEVIEDTKENIRWNLSVQTQLFEKNRN